ncbi:MAG: Hsp20/alpha crystallin family protein [Armatimonadetes bacterium]|nr:Hsp20/alpha crystallin family protein [Armatimonadota bacterium]
MDAHLPVNIYHEGDRLMVAAPMPGMEPQDIEINLEGSRLAIRAHLRGPGQERKSFLRQEWTSGPYERTLVLPRRVDGSRANATYDNGILVLILPITEDAQAVSAQLHMLKIGTAKGQLVGHVGHLAR